MFFRPCEFYQNAEKSKDIPFHCNTLSSKSKTKNESVLHWVNNKALVHITIM